MSADAAMVRRPMFRGLITGALVVVSIAAPSPAVQHVQHSTMRTAVHAKARPQSDRRPLLNVAVMPATVPSSATAEPPVLVAVARPRPVRGLFVARARTVERARAP